MHDKVLFSLLSNVFFLNLKTLGTQHPDSCGCSRNRDESPFIYIFLCTLYTTFIPLKVSVVVSVSTIFTHPFFTLSKFPLHLEGSSPAAAGTHPRSQISRAIATSTAFAPWGWPQPWL